MFQKILIICVVVSVFGSIRGANAQSPDYCNDTAALIPHPTSCQRYTNCSKVPPYGFSRYFKDQEEECPYPQLFDVVQYTCKSFQEAVCGRGRVAAKDPCDYLKNKCNSAHCEPCTSRLPSCVGLSDGIHAHQLKLWSPYFTECDSERTTAVRRCPKHVPTSSVTVFSCQESVCASVGDSQS